MTKSRLIEMNPITLRVMGVSFTQDHDELVVSFRDGRRERWIPAPPDWPLDGSREVIRFDGVVWCPVESLVMGQ